MNDSSHLKDAVYDEARKTMRVTFKGGEEYEYPGVPKEDFDALHSAQSPGSFLRQWIIPRYGKGRRTYG